MEQNAKNPQKIFRENDVNQILTGVELKVQYLGSGDLPRSGGTDNDIATVIHDIHSLYSQRKASIKKARTVAVFIDSQRINVYTSDKDETIFSFPLSQVKDVTTCLDQPPYSKTCVLVAREDNKALYKAYVFYCNTTKQAAHFYQVASLAFRVGDDLLEKFTYFNESANKRTLSSSKSSFQDPGVEGLGEINQEEKGLAVDSKDGSNKILERSHFAKESLCFGGQKDRTNQRTVTVQLQSDKHGSASWKNDEHQVKFDLGFSETNNNLRPSKLAVYVDNVEETSRFILSRWFRSSYRQFRKTSGRGSPAQDV